MTLFDELQYNQACFVVNEAKNGNIHMTFHVKSLQGHISDF